MAKSAEAFRTISEVAEWLDLPTHVLRFWESKFTQVKPVKRAGGRRYYRPNDMLLLGGIKKLLHDDGMTIKGAQKILREQGVKEVSALSQPLDTDGHGTPDSGDVIEHRKAALSSDPASPPEPPEPETAIEDLPLPSNEVEAQATSKDSLEATPEKPLDETLDLDPDADQENEALEAPVPEQITTEPEASPARADALPSFLKGDAEDAGEIQPVRPSLSVETPKDPQDDALDVPAGALSRLAASKGPLSAQQCADLAKVKSALLDRMAAA